MIWWYWIVLGLVLAALELATPGGFFVIFFALSAVVLGVLELTGVLTSDAVQWFLFPVIAGVLLALFRRPLLARMRRNDPDTVDTLIGEVALVIDTILPGAHGRAELRGSRWSARNIDSSPLEAGQRSRVVAVRGLELDIRRE